MTYNLAQKKIGIWGYGITGKAAVDYLSNQSIELALFDKKELSQADQEYLKAHNVALYPQDHMADFLTHCDYILPSPGIDLSPYPAYESKWLNELDLFYAAWNKPIIAITGSVGKTTVTHLLSKLLEQAGDIIATGGNIGTPMFDLFKRASSNAIAILELSSFQLEHTKSFAPDLAIWTNLHPNHLDRHGSMAAYGNAKAHMLAFQTPDQQALIPFERKDMVKTRAQLHYFALEKPSHELLHEIHNESAVFYFNESGQLIRFKNGSEDALKNGIQEITRASLPTITFDENWLILHSALDLLKKPITSYATLDLPEHRMEKVATINGIDFINDSKATTAQSTLAAVNCLKQRPILLLLGGKGKGTNRELLVAALKHTVKKVYCFGAEASQLHAYCTQHSITSSAFENLDAAFAEIIQDMKPGDQVLLSPGGTSYDLYTIFSERGDHFKKLVQALT